MGTKSSKVSTNGSNNGNSGLRDQKEIINHIRRTIRKGNTQSADMHSLGRQFQSTSSIDPEQILSNLKINKQLLNAIRKNSAIEFRQLLRSLKLPINTILDHNYQLTCLHLATMLGKPQIITAMLSSLDIDVNILTKTGDTPLILGIKCEINENNCYHTISPLIQDKRCHIARTNAVGATGLSIAVAKGFLTIVKLLVTNGRIRIYTPIDLAMAIKLALIYEREDLVEIIINEMDGTSSQIEFTNLLESNPELNSLAIELKKMNLNGARGSGSGYYLDEIGREVDDNYVKIMAAQSPSPPTKKPPNFMLTVSTTADSLASKSTKDNTGQKLIIGDLVQILSEDIVTELNPRIATEYDFIEGIANHKAHIHDIDSEGDIYIDVLDTPYAGHVNAKCVKFLNHGPKQKLDSGQQVTIGYYVRVIEGVNMVKELAKGHGGWKEEMSQYCGRTGKIRNIDKDGDIFVHFPTGVKHCFNPKSLTLSSANDIEAKDLYGEWIKKGVIARVTADEQEFRFLQEEIELDAIEEKYSAILGKLVYVRKLRLFLQYTDAVVIPYNQFNNTGNVEVESSSTISYNLNPKCLQLIPAMDDQNGQSIIIGSLVELNKNMLPSTVEPEEYEKLMKNVGTIVDLDVRHSFNRNSNGEAIVQVEFDGIGIFDFGPEHVLVKNRKPSIGSSLLPLPQAGGTAGRRRRRESRDADDTGYVSREEERLSDENVHRSRNNSADSHKSFTSTVSVGSAFEVVQLIPRKDLIMKKKLGEGGFGLVTTGSWKGTECAIKQIRPIVLSDIDYENILKEARIQYGLKHPNIVQLYGISYDNDLWMVMQLVNGIDLHALLFRGDEYGNREKVGFNYKMKICLQTTNAISYLHDKGFIHNDLKPENIMVERKTGHVYVCDFGITRYLGQVDLRTYSQQYTTSFGGTLPYIAPECYQKDPIENRYLSPTFNSDIWSLGAVFTELFIEKELFPNERALCLYKIMNDYSGVKIMLKLVEDLSIRNMLTKCLEPEPLNRPNADELSTFFHHVIERRFN